MCVISFDIQPSTSPLPQLSCMYKWVFIYVCCYIVFLMLIFKFLQNDIVLFDYFTLILIVILPWVWDLRCICSVRVTLLSVLVEPHCKGHLKKCGKGPTKAGNSWCRWLADSFDRPPLLGLEFSMFIPNATIHQYRSESNAHGKFLYQLLWKKYPMFGTIFAAFTKVVFRGRLCCTSFPGPCFHCSAA